MEGFVTGDVVIVNWEFSDGSGSKRRPALVLADPLDDYDNLILCAITSRSRPDRLAIPLAVGDFFGPPLKYPESTVMPHIISTFSRLEIIARVARISDAKLREVKARVIRLFSS